MKKYNTNKNGGFTIIEAMIAIFILSVSVASMLGVNATSASFARYANNELTANYLAQEAVDSIRNSRDTIAFQQKENDDTTGIAWKKFLDRYGYKNGTGSDRCFSSNGCYLKMENFDPKDSNYNNGNDVVECPSGVCPLLKYDSKPLDPSVIYKSTGNSDSIFSRKVTMVMIKDYEVKIVVQVDWDNGNGSMKSRSLEMYLLNWMN